MEKNETEMTKRIRVFLFNGERRAEPNLMLTLSNSGPSNKLVSRKRDETITFPKRSRFTVSVK